MVKYTIPRNIKVREVVAFGLNVRQIIYIGTGLAGAIGSLALPIPIDLRIVTGVISTTCGVAFSLSKCHGQDLDKYIFNSAVYPIRAKEWQDNVQQKENVIRIRFHSRKSSPVQGLLAISHEGSEL